MRGLLLALAGSFASGALLDEEASTAPVTFGGGSSRRAAHPLLHSEEVPDWVRLTFADHYLGATRRSAPVDAFEEAVDGEMEEEKRGLELLEESEASRADLFDSRMPADHAHAVSELNVHRHVAPIGGIFHLAGSLDACHVAEMEWPRVQSVYGGKADGAAHLHAASVALELPLQHFVLFSSVYALFGCAQ